MLEQNRETNFLLTYRKRSLVKPLKVWPNTWQDYDDGDLITIFLSVSELLDFLGLKCIVTAFFTPEGKLISFHVYELDRRSERGPHVIIMYNATDYIMIATIVRQGEKQDSRS